MSAIKSAEISPQNSMQAGTTFVSEPFSGAELTVGSGFKAQSFRARDMHDVMDPLVMVDHYVMTASTFGAHPHAGMSAVSLLFEDSKGFFRNQDSLGNDFDLQPGDLYWLKAGSGAVHDEFPRPNASIHGLQVFVNVPQSRRFETPDSLLVRANDMPLISNAGVRVKVALGESNGVQGAVSPSTSMTILDGTIQSDGSFTHQADASRGIWLHDVEGSLDVTADGVTRHLTTGQGLAIKTASNTDISLRNTSTDPVHFVLFDGAQVSEPYVQDGPFVMGSEAEIVEIKAAYEAGRLGRIYEN